MVDGCATSAALFSPRLSRFVRPRQYHIGTTGDVEKLLLEQKEQAPNRIPYLMCRKGPPGFINLMYLPGKT